jgi:hypothetical protein
MEKGKIPFINTIIEGCGSDMTDKRNFGFIFHCELSVTFSHLLQTQVNHRNIRDRLGYPERCHNYLLNL